MAKRSGGALRAACTGLVAWLACITAAGAQEACELYPIALPQALLDAGGTTHYTKVKADGTSTGFSWLTWDGATDAPSLAAALTPPGTLESYTHPDEPTDHSLERGDWMGAMPGVKNSRAVREALDALIGQSIEVPTWDEVRGRDMAYRTYASVRIVLEAYALGGNGWLSFRMAGRGACFNRPPRALPLTAATDEDTPLTLTLRGEDPDGDALTFTLRGPPAHGSATLEGDQLTYTPAPNYHGPDALSYSAHDGLASSESAAVSLTVAPVNDPPTHEPLTLIGREDTPLTATLQGEDVDGDTLTYALAAPPAHGEVSIAGDTLTYTPHADYHGPDTFTVQADDGQSRSALATVSLELAPVNDPPVVHPATVELLEDGSAVFTLVASDVDGDALSYRILRAPANGTLSGTAPHLTYTPAADYHGSDSLSVAVSDGQSESVPATIAFTIAPVNDPPVAEAADVSGSEDQPLALTLRAFDADGDLLHYLITTAPAHGTLSGEPPNLIYTPAPDYFGPDRFAFAVSDGQVQSAEAEIRIELAGVADPPSITITAPTEGGSYASGQPVQLTAQVSDPDQDAEGIEVTWHSSLQGTLASGARAEAALTAGTHLITATAVDAEGLRTEHSVGITVAAAHSPVQAYDIRLAAEQDAGVGIQLFALDPDGDTLTYRIIEPPAHGTLSGEPPYLTYTPEPGYVGPDHFTYAADDGSGESLARVDIEVREPPPNAAPVAEDQSLHVEQDGTLAVTLSAADPDGDPLTYVITREPAHGSLFGEGAHRVYLPEAGYVGPDAFTFTAGDGSAADEGRIDITVTNLNDAPVITSQAPTRVEVGSEYRYALKATDPDGDPLTYTLVEGPEGMTIDANGLITWTPDESYAGSLDVDNPHCKGPGPDQTRLEPTRKWRVEGGTYGMPVVGHLIDTNADGRVDARDEPMVLVRFQGEGKPWGYGPVGVVHGSTGELMWQRTDLVGIAAQAYADLDNDGWPEVITDANERLVILNGHDGAVRAISEERTYDGKQRRGVAIASADLDGDGIGEILYQGKVFDIDGSVLWDSGIDAFHTLPVDLDLDGIYEVITANDVYDAYGNHLFTLPIGRSDVNGIALGGLDEDPYPEILVNAGNTLYAVEHSGATKWSIALPSPSNGSAAVADFNGDGRPEVGLVSADYILMISHDGRVLWTRRSSDYTRFLGASGFDFLDRGAANLLAQSQFGWVVVAFGESPVSLYQPQARTYTQHEYPVVADIDADGRAELVIYENEGFTALEDSFDRWPGTGTTWNQYHYRAGALHEDGTLAPPPSEWTFASTFRTAPAYPHSRLPDVQIGTARLVGENQLAVSVSNRGTAATQPTALNLYSTRTGVEGVPGHPLGIRRRRPSGQPYLADGAARALRLRRGRQSHLPRRLQRRYNRVPL